VGGCEWGLSWELKLKNGSPLRNSEKKRETCKAWRFERADERQEIWGVSGWQSFTWKKKDKPADRRRFLRGSLMFKTSNAGLLAGNLRGGKREGPTK